MKQPQPLEVYTDVAGEQFCALHDIFGARIRVHTYDGKDGKPELRVTTDTGGFDSISVWLTQEQLLALLPRLQHWAVTGKLEADR